MKNTTKKQTLTMVQIALLSAIVVVLQLFFSAVKIGVVTLNFVLVPIVIAGVLLGAKAGFIVGAFAGITTFIQVFTSGDPFYMFLMANNPVATACICILKTGLAGLCVGLLAKAFKKFQNGNLERTYICAYPVAAICPIVNTGLFCLGMMLFFAKDMLVDPLFAGSVGNGVVYFIIFGLAGLNFVIELILNIILCPILILVLKKTKYFN